MGLKLVLLDRDGVLNEDDKDYVRTPDGLVMIPGSAAAVGRLNAAGVKVAVVTNQGGMGRGLMTEAALGEIHDRLRRELAAADAWLDAIYFCPDQPDRPTERRKPAPGMLLEALAEFGADPATTPMIGDALRDMQAGRALGCPRFLVRTGQGEATLSNGLTAEVEPVSIHDDLASVVDTLLDRNGGR